MNEKNEYDSFVHERIVEKRKRWGVTWIRIDDNLWFVNTPEDSFRCGIWCGVSREQLSNPKALEEISAVKEYWYNYLSETEEKR